MSSPFLDIDLVRLSAQKGAVHLDNEFILIDNLSGETGTTESEPMFVNHPVKLSFSIVMFCISGSMRFRINLQDFELRANDVLIGMEGSIGEYYGMSPGTRIALVASSGEYFHITNQAETAMSLQRQLYSGPLCHMRPEVFAESMTLYRLMKSKIGEIDNPFRKGALQGYVQVLSSVLFNCFRATEAANEKSQVEMSRHYELYARFFREVQKSYTRERSISYYADQLCVTPKYLSQVVRKISGRLAGEWISDYVILEAKALLKSRRYTVQQISNMLNFANQSFFGKYFKDKVGCSPRAYQQSK